MIKELTTSFVLNSGAPANYGKSVFLDTNRGLKRWQHGGNDVAHRSRFVYDPDLDAGYVVFSNYQDVPGSLSTVVADAFFGVKMTAAPQRPVANATFAGRYFSQELETFYDPSVEGGKLVIRHRRFGPVTLTNTNGDTFSGTLPVMEVVFRRDAQGNVTGFDAGNGRARGIVFKTVNR